MDLKKIDLNKFQDYAFTVNELMMFATCDDKFINIRCLDNENIVPTVKAIPLDKIKQAREEIENITWKSRIHTHTKLIDRVNVLTILDRLITESEEK